MIERRYEISFWSENTNVVVYGKLALLTVCGMTTRSATVLPSHAGVAAPDLLWYSLHVRAGLCHVKWRFILAIQLIDCHPG